MLIVFLTILIIWTILGVAFVSICKDDRDKELKTLSIGPLLWAGMSIGYLVIVIKYKLTPEKERGDKPRFW